jgi:hypothetical protein
MCGTPLDYGDDDALSRRLAVYAIEDAGMCCIAHRL